MEFLDDGAEATASLFKEIEACAQRMGFFLWVSPVRSVMPCFPKTMSAQP